MIDSEYETEKSLSKKNITFTKMSFSLLIHEVKFSCELVSFFCHCYSCGRFNRYSMVK